MPRYERYHGVTIPAEAIHAAVELSVRYLPGRYLPDKANRPAGRGRGGPRASPAGAAPG